MSAVIVKTVVKGKSFGKAAGGDFFAGVTTVSNSPNAPSLVLRFHCIFDYARRNRKQFTPVLKNYDGDIKSLLNSFIRPVYGLC